MKDFGAHPKAVIVPGDEIMPVATEYRTPLQRAPSAVHVVQLMASPSSSSLVECFIHSECCT